MGRRFGRIYELQRAQHAYANPQQMWQALGLYNVTQQSAASYMEVGFFVRHFTLHSRQVLCLQSASVVFLMYCIGTCQD